jgi:hypothetical protein
MTSSTKLNHKTTKWYSVREHFIRDLVQSGALIVQYCDTVNMPADMLTKVLAILLCADIGILRWPPPDSSHDIVTWTSVSLQISLLRWISGVLCTYVSEPLCWKLALTVGINESRLTLRETSCDFYRFHIMEGAPSSEYSSWSLILFKCVQYKHARYCQVESRLSFSIRCNSPGRAYSARVCV